MSQIPFTRCPSELREAVIKKLKPKEAMQLLLVNKPLREYILKEGPLSKSAHLLEILIGDGYRNITTEFRFFYDEKNAALMHFQRTHLDDYKLVNVVDNRLDVPDNLLLRFVASVRLVWVHVKSSGTPVGLARFLSDFKDNNVYETLEVHIGYDPSMIEELRATNIDRLGMHARVPAFQALAKAVILDGVPSKNPKTEFQLIEGGRPKSPLDPALIFDDVPVRSIDVESAKGQLYRQAYHSIRTRGQTYVERKPEGERLYLFEPRQQPSDRVFVLRTWGTSRGFSFRTYDAHFACFVP